MDVANALFMCPRIVDKSTVITWACLGSFLVPGQSSVALCRDNSLEFYQMNSLLDGKEPSLAYDLPFRSVDWMGVLRSERAGVDALFLLLSDLSWKILRVSQSSGNFEAIHGGSFAVPPELDASKQHLFEAGAAFVKPTCCIHQNDVYAMVYSFRVEKISVNGLHLRSATSVTVSSIPLEHQDLTGQEHLLSVDSFCVLPVPDSLGHMCVCAVAGNSIETFSLKKNHVFKDGPFSMENIANGSRRSRVLPFPSAVSVDARYKSAVILVSDDSLAVLNESEGKMHEHVVDLIPSLCCPSGKELFLVDCAGRLLSWPFSQPASEPRVIFDLTCITDHLYAVYGDDFWTSLSLLVLSSQSFLFCNRSGTSLLLSRQGNGVSVHRLFESVGPLMDVSLVADAPFQTALLTSTGYIGAMCHVAHVIASSEAFSNVLFDTFFVPSANLLLMTSPRTTVIMDAATFAVVPSTSVAVLDCENETIFVDDRIQVTRQEVRWINGVLSQAPEHRYKTLSPFSRACSCDKYVYAFDNQQNLHVLSRDSSLMCLVVFRFDDEVSACHAPSIAMLCVAFWNGQIGMYDLRSSLPSTSNKNSPALVDIPAATKTIPVSMHGPVRLCRSMHVTELGANERVISCAYSDGTLRLIRIKGSSMEETSFMLGEAHINCVPVTGTNLLICGPRSTDTLVVVNTAACALHRIVVPDRLFRARSFALVSSGASQREMSLVCIDETVASESSLIVLRLPDSILHADPHLHWRRVVPISPPSTRQAVLDCSYLSSSGCFISVLASGDSDVALRCARTFPIPHEASYRVSSFCKAALGHFLRVIVLTGTDFLLMFETALLVFRIEGSATKVVKVVYRSCIYASDYCSKLDPATDSLSGSFAPAFAFLGEDKQLAVMTRERLLVFSVRSLLAKSHPDLFADTAFFHGSAGHVIAAFNNLIAVSVLFEHIFIYRLDSRADRTSAALVPYCKVDCGPGNTVASMCFLSDEMLVVADHCLKMTLVRLVPNDLADAQVSGDLLSDPMSLLWRELSVPDGANPTWTHDDIRWELQQRTTFPFKAVNEVWMHLGLLVNDLCLTTDTLDCVPLSADERRGSDKRPHRLLACAANGALLEVAFVAQKTAEQEEWIAQVTRRDTFSVHNSSVA